jgi:hypothetical protein
MSVSTATLVTHANEHVQEVPAFLASTTACVIWADSPLACVLVWTTPLDIGQLPPVPTAW